MEIMLRELEFASMLALVNADALYPQKEIEKIWKEVLLYQFHDILPRSSIKRVYDESIERYQVIYEKTEQLTQQAYLAVAQKISVAEVKNPFIIFNSLSWERNEQMKIDGKWIDISIPPMGYSVIAGDKIEKSNEDLVVTEDVLENEIIKIKFSKDGTIQSIFDKEYKREVIEKGKIANKLSIYIDNGDAWDFDINYDEKPCDSYQLESKECYVDGPRVIAKYVYKYGKSQLIQEVALTKGSRRIDFITEVQWEERNKMLRTSFPVDVYTREAVCDIQFGTMKRPTHRNTSWDIAKFEICAHKWVDLSQRDYGVALLNDCKYGYKVLENTMDLNLLRSIEYPDADADRGKHQFTYALYPHNGDYVVGEVAKKAYELNIPLYFIKGNSSEEVLPKAKAFIEIIDGDLIIETIKKTEDDRSLIIRIYENNNDGVNAKICFNFDVKSVQLVNIMEENIEELLIDKGIVNLRFRPFEIHTLKVLI